MDSLEKNLLYKNMFALDDTPNETIVAVGTPPGIGALGIVRLSGQNTGKILKLCFLSQDLDLVHSHRFFFGTWKIQSQAPLDEVIVLYLPKVEAIREPAADIICHGNPQILQLVIAIGSYRQAPDLQAW